MKDRGLRTYSISHVQKHENKSWEHHCAGFSHIFLQIEAFCHTWTNCKAQAFASSSTKKLRMHVFFLSGPLHSVDSCNCTKEENHVWKHMLLQECECTEF